jgi:hypothetical protein
MATSSAALINMTVPGPGSDSNDGNGILMPKLQYRFRVLFEGFGGPGAELPQLTKQIIDIARPQVQFGEITIPVYNSTMYLAGKHAWQTTTINLRDDASGKVAKAVGQQLQKQMDFVNQASAASGIDYKFQVNYEVLDGGNGAGASGPTVLEKWELYGCFLQTVNYNTLNYATNEPVSISLTVRFDNAIQSPIGSGVGANIGRTLGDTITGFGR